MAGTATSASVVVGAIEAANAQDKQGLFRLLRPDVEWHVIGLFPDRPGPYRGREEVWEFMQLLREDFHPWETDVLELADLGDQVVARHRSHGRRRDGQEQVEVSFSTVYRLEGGRILRGDNYDDHDEALNDAELRRGTA